MEERARVAIIGSRGMGNYGGIEVVLAEVCPRLAAAGYEIDVYSRRDAQMQEGENLKVMRVGAVGGKHLENLSRSGWSTLMALRRDYDLLHFQAIGPGIFTALTALAGRRSLVTVQGLDWQRDKWAGFAKLSLRTAERILVRCATAVSVCSHSLRQYFLDTYGLETHVVPTGLPAARRLPPGKYLRSIGLAEGDYVLFAARLVAEKACHELLEAFAGLTTDKRLVIAGGGGERGYEATLRAKADPRRVIFVGHVPREHLAELISNAYLFVHPSHLEGMSAVLLQALALRRPMLLSDIRENSEVAGAEACYFRTGDVEDLRAKLRLLLMSDERVRNMAAALSRSAKRYPNWDEVAQGYARVYETVLSNSRDLVLMDV